MQFHSLLHPFLMLLCFCAAPCLAAPLLVVDAVPDPEATWLAERPAQYTAWLESQQVGAFLQLVAPVFGSRLEASRPLRVHLVALHAGDHLRARTLGDDLAVQIRQEDTPDRRTDVIVHEAVHALQQRTGVTSQLPGFPAPAQALVDEALATAIGQGLWRWLAHALADVTGEVAWRQGRDRYAEDNARPWYVAPQTGVQIDAWARLLQPCVTQAVAYGTPIQAALPALETTWQQAESDIQREGR